MDERVWDPETMDEAIPPLNGSGRSERSASGANGSSDGHEAPVSLNSYGLKVWRGERPVVKEGQIDRSASLYKIGAYLGEAGATDSAIEAALAERDLSLGWRCYTDRSDAREQYAVIAEKVPKIGNGAPGKPYKKKKKAGKEDDAPTHDELRDRWLEANYDHAHGLGDWRRYEGGIWTVVKTPVVKKSMVEVLEGAKTEGIRPSVFVVNSVHALAQFEAYVPDEKWDSNPDILVAENGTIDITTGKLRPHAMSYYATSRVPYAFNPDAKAPNWERFIGDLDEKVAGFLQEFAGYCLTTDTSYEKAVWLIGQPGGGKSTFLEGMLATLGVRAGVLGLAEIEKSRFSLAKLEGKTLVTAAEQPAGFVTCHHILNASISGEKVQIERKYRDPYDLVPRAKIAWAMNELPRIPSGAEGLFRRVEVIKFPEIPEKERDPALKEGVKCEGAGILNWALEGLMRLRERGGFDVPAKIADATAEFREHNDTVGQFVEERCKTGNGLFIKSSELYSAYKDWCEQTSHKPKNSTTIVQDWERLGFTKEKRKDCNYWQGVELIEYERWR
jgi:P4 family phage/plasmid primase-like protien